MIQYVNPLYALMDGEGYSQSERGGLALRDEILGPCAAEGVQRVLRPVVSVTQL